jgi:outer membrane protein TolC
VYSQWIGTTVGVIDAEIHSKVNGYLLAQDYQEGSVVKRGDLLFEVDPRPFHAVVDQAKAQLNVANAGLTRAKADVDAAKAEIDRAEAAQLKTELDVKRYSPLAKDGTVSQQELEDFFPRFGLTALLGRVRPELSSLSGGAADIWALAASFSGPIFTGDRLTNQYRAAVDVFDQAKNQYSQSALRAFRVMSDALIASQKLSAIEKQQKREVAALDDSVSIARPRYLGGLARYDEVLEAQQLL